MRRVGKGRRLCPPIRVGSCSLPTLRRADQGQVFSGNDFYGPILYLSSLDQKQVAHQFQCGLCYFIALAQLV